jgi:3'-phosphoadenosine 5'-phosphosulfate sulfotransferase (PAPS reductase)/FAD synthetase
MIQLTHLQKLEAESIHIFREVAAECENPVFLYSIGKDSAVLLHLALKAFYPSKPPFPLLHVDTTWKFKEMIEFRDQRIKDLDLELLVHINQEGVDANVNPFASGSRVHTDVMKTQGLKQALDKYKFDAAFGGARRNAYFRCVRPNIAGTRKTSGPSPGGFTTRAKGRAKVFASSRCPTGPKRTCGTISPGKTFPSCRCISPRNGRWCGATAR